MTNVMYLFDQKRMASLTNKEMESRELYWVRQPAWRTPEQIGLESTSQSAKFYGRLASFRSDHTADIGPVDDEESFWRTAHQVVLSIDGTTDRQSEAGQ